MKASELLQQILANRRGKVTGPDVTAAPLAGAPAPLAQPAQRGLAASAVLGGLQGTQAWLAKKAQRSDEGQQERDDFGYEHVRRTAEQQQGRNQGPFDSENPRFGVPTAPRPSINAPVAPPERRERPAFGTPESVHTRFGLMPGFRRGGEMQPGVPAVVGEEEPEVVIPKQPSVAIPVSDVLRAVQAGQAAPVEQVAPVPEAEAGSALPTPSATPGAVPGTNQPPVSASRTILDEVGRMREQRDAAAARKVTDDDGRLKSAGKNALYGGLAALSATGDWRAGLAGAAAGAGLGAVRPQTDDEIERMHEVQGFDQRIDRSRQQAQQTLELEGKVADIEDRRAQREGERERRDEDRRSRGIDLVMKLYGAAEAYDPAKDTALRRRAAALGLELPAKERHEQGETRFNDKGQALFFPAGGGAARPILNADGTPYVDPSKRLVVEDGLAVTPNEALSYRATQNENAARRQERTEDRRAEQDRQKREDRLKALEADVSRDSARATEADKAESEIVEAQKKLRAAFAQRDLAAQNLDRVRKLNEEDSNTVSAKDVSDAEAALETTRKAVEALHDNVGILSNRNKQQYGDLFEQDEGNWTARRVKGRFTEAFIRLQGLRNNRSDAEINATIEDARKQGLLR